MRFQVNQKYYFLVSLAVLCLFYFGLEFFLNSYNMLAIDEFWFAHLIYHYKDALPYRDFAPYKTVLGYYLLLLPMLTSQGILQTLFFTKHAITLLNTFLFFSASWWLTRYFTRASILISLTLLFTSDIVLSYSTNIRVDLLGYWFCFFAFLFLLEYRFFLAGFLLGLGFITTQKAVWYIVATNIAFMSYLFIFAYHQKKFTVPSEAARVCEIKSPTLPNKLLGLLYYNLTLVFVMAAYIAIWSYIADWHTVMTSIFHEASVLYQLDWYNGARKLFWSAILQYNPLLIALWPLTLISLVVTFDHDKSYPYRLMAVMAGLVILLCLIPYKMIFPYYMQVTIPILLIVYTAFFSWLLCLFNPHQIINLLIPKKILWLFLIFYVSVITYVIVEFELSQIYLLICLLPLLLGILITYRTTLSEIAQLFRQLFFIIIIFTGGIYPLAQIYLKINKFHSDYQTAQINVINALLQDGSDYVAGIELIYNKTQPIPGMRQLVGPAIDYLTSPSANAKLRPFMLASLYQDPNATSASVITALKNADVKFYVNTYRMAALPANIKHYLSSQYEHCWGSIYLYAPQVTKHTNQVTLKFSGRYLIESLPFTQILFGGKKYAPLTVIPLKKGTYTSQATGDYRLKLLPDDVKSLLNQKFQREQLMKIVW